MRVLIDTNVLISAALNINSVPFQAYVKAASYPKSWFNMWTKCRWNEAYIQQKVS